MHKTFWHTALFAFLGAFLGLVAGLVLGYIIYFLLLILPPAGDLRNSPAEIAPFMGMVWGSILGAVFGGIAGLRSKK